MTIDKALEAAMVEIIEEIMLSELPEVPFSVVSFVAREDEPRQIVEYPAIKVMATPFEPDHGNECAVQMGMVSVEIAVKTSIDSDPDRQILESIWEILEDNFTKANIGGRVESPWLVCGYNRSTGQVGIDTNEDEKTQEKNRIVRVAVARITTTSTTT